MDMTLIEAIKAPLSERLYMNTPLLEDVITVLQQKISVINIRMRSCIIPLV